MNIENFDLNKVANFLDHELYGEEGCVLTINRVSDLVVIPGSHITKYRHQVIGDLCPKEALNYINLRRPYKVGDILRLTHEGELKNVVMICQTDPNKVSLVCLEGGNSITPPTSVADPELIFDSEVQCMLGDKDHYQIEKTIRHVIFK